MVFHRGEHQNPSEPPPGPLTAHRRQATRQGRAAALPPPMDPAPRTNSTLQPASVRWTAHNQQTLPHGRATPASRAERHLRRPRRPGDPMGTRRRRRRVYHRRDAQRQVRSPHIRTCGPLHVRIWGCLHARHGQQRSMDQVPTRSTRGGCPSESSYRPRHPYMSRCGRVYIYMRGDEDM